MHRSQPGFLVVRRNVGWEGLLFSHGRRESMAEINVGKGTVEDGGVSVAL